MIACVEGVEGGDACFRCSGGGGGEGEWGVGLDGDDEFAGFIVVFLWCVDWVFFLVCGLLGWLWW